MIGHEVPRDERTVATENASYRYAYLLLSYGLLLSTAYRSFVHDQQTWDLLALVVLGGLVATVYQGFNRVLTRRWGFLSVATLVGALILAVLIVVLRS